MSQGRNASQKVGNHWLKCCTSHLVQRLGIDLSIDRPVHLSEDLVLAELLSVTLSDDSVWMYVPSVAYPNDLRLTEVFSVTLFHDLRSVNKVSCYTMLRKLIWKIVNQIPLGTIPVNDRTKRFANSC